jgi:hypothetical protein
MNQAPNPHPANDFWDKQKLSFWLNIGLALLICSKFYYLFGVNDFNKPVAPNAVILLRDVISFSFLFFFGWHLRKTIFQERLFWSLFGAGLAVSLIQFFWMKDLVTWGQHYFRNILLPLLFYPIFLNLFRQQIKLSIRPIFIWLFAVNIFLSYAQFYFSKGFIRPTGIFGDPIINSVFVLLGFISVALSRGKISILIASILLVPMIQYLSSLSALISIILGAATVFLISKNQWLEYFQKNLKKAVLTTLGSLCLIVFLAWITQITHQKSVNGAASEKAQALFNSAFCKEEGCQHWSYQGRIESNLRPFRLCRESWVSCLIGNVQTPNYERIESTWGSLVANWGAIFCIIYLFWIFVHILKAQKVPMDLSTSDPDLIFWQMIFYSGLYFCLFNTVPYKFPINIVWYASMAFIAAQSQHKAKS